MRSLVVSLHDVSPLTQELCEPILQQLREVGIGQTSLLVIPNHHGRAPIAENPEFGSWLSRWVEAGHEPVLHGYFHRRPAVTRDSVSRRLITEFYTAGEGEFYDLSFSEALHRLEKGLADLAFLPRRINGFIAPAWLLGREAEKAVQVVGFRYTTHLNKVRRFAPASDCWSQSLVWSTRARWRTTLSKSWNRCIASLLARAPLLRIGIHPPDLQISAVWEQVKDIVRNEITSREVISYEKFVEKSVKSG